MAIAAPARLVSPANFKKFQYLLLLLYFGALFAVLLFPVRKLEYAAAEVANQRQLNYEAFYQGETTAEGRAYAWTRPEAQLYFLDVPRYAPLQIELELNFDRPGNVPPAQLEISEMRSREPAQLLATLTPNPQRSGFQTYTLTAPPCTTCETGLTLELKTNGFRPPGEQRTLGVVMDHFSVKLGYGHYRYLLWPQPYLVGVLLVALALVGWLWRTGAGLVTGLLMLSGPALCLAIFAPVLYDDSWWVIGCSLLMLVSVGLNLPFFRLPSLPNAGLVGLLLASAALIIILAIIPLYATDIKDLQLYQNWLKDLQSNGLFNIYNHSPNLDYLPLLLYFLWFYSLITAPFGLTNDPIALKLFFSLPVLVNVCLLWRMGVRYRVSGVGDKGFPAPHNDPEETTNPNNINSLTPATRHPLPVTRYPSPTLLVIALSITLIFNAAVWGQTDTLLACMLVWTLLAIQSGKPILAGTLLGLDVALKPQSWIIAPLLALFILREFGWRKTISGGLVGLVLLVGFSAPAFGFDPESFRRFLFQPAFAGELNLGSINAWNLLYLFGYGTKEAPQVVAWGGVAIIGLVYGLVAWWCFFGRGKASSSENWTRQALGAGLVLIIFFLCAIKMRERYIEYGLLFVGLAALYAGWRSNRAGRGLLLAFLGLDLLSLLNMLAIYVVHRNQRDYKTIFLWREIVLANWLPGVVAVAYLLIFGYLLQLFIRNFWKEPFLKTSRRDAKG
jgi:hypothetical protein